MKVKLLGLAVVAALAAAAPSFGKDAPIVAKAIAVGKMKATTIQAQTGTTILESYRVAPGGSFGWHVHGAPVAVVVASGTLTVEQAQRHRLQRPGHRRHLGQDVDAVLVVLDHALEPSHLALDAAQPLQIRVLLAGVARHASTVRQPAEPAGS
jgi:hypothetical protein